MPKFDIEAEFNGLTFSDSIMLTDDEYAVIGDDGVETIRTQRIEAWIANALLAPAPPEEGE